MPKKPTLINLISRDIKNTRELTDAMRNLDRAMDALRDHDPAANFSKRLLTGMQSLMRSVRRELLYALLIPLKLVLISAFNIVALFLFFWLLTFL